MLLFKESTVEGSNDGIYGLLRVHTPGYSALLSLPETNTAFVLLSLCAITVFVLDKIYYYDIEANIILNR